MSTRDQIEEWTYENGDIIGITNAAALVKRSASTLKDWVDSGEIQSYTSKGDPRTLVSLSEVRALIAPRRIMLP